jgi:2-polyprenyl-3-methyl-5-hydroxy-6-metoxy-1,4-benzoquinol methylase
MATNPVCRYLGVDVNQEVIQQARWDVRMSGLPYQDMWSFTVMDLRKGVLPSGYDLLLAVDLLEHMDLEDALEVLINLQRSSADVRPCL